MHVLQPHPAPLKSLPPVEEASAVMSGAWHGA